MDGNGLARHEVAVALDRKDEPSAHSLKLENPHAAEFGATHAKIAEPEGNGRAARAWAGSSDRYCARDRSPKGRDTAKTGLGSPLWTTGTTSTVPKGGSILDADRGSKFNAD